MADREPRVDWATFRAHRRRVRERSKRNFDRHFKQQVRVSLGLAIVAAAIAVGFHQGLRSAFYGVAAYAVWITIASVVFHGSAAADLDADLRGDLVTTREDLKAALEVDGFMPAEISLKEPFPYDDRMHFRVCVVNKGDRKAAYSAEVTKLENQDPRGPEAMFPLFWRHGSKRRIVEIAPEAEEHEYDVEIATVNKIPVDAARGMEVARWQPTIQFRVHQEEGQDWITGTSAFQGIESVDDMASAWMRARVVIRHHPSLRIAAGAWLRFAFAEEGGLFVPTIALEST